MSQGTMTVSSLNTKIKSLLETTFMHILVEGEVSSVTYHNSGHVYFSIKDKESSIKCVMFRSNSNKMKFRLERGQHVVVNGSISVYTPRGEYQLMTLSIEPFGQGALALAYEQLKEKLQKKGYFEQSNKKYQPQYLKKIALVTASKSAALQDMLKIIEKRWRLLEVVVIDTLVQGDKSAQQIAEALKYADTLGCDAIVVGRGGGSKEDLWAFNEEVVADAIYNLNTFVVSAVGHEVDVQISDFVADLRAPTPSAAMEMILPDQNEILYTLNEMQERYVRVMKQLVGNKEKNLKAFEEEFGRHSVSRKIAIMEKEFEILEDEFKRVMQYQMTQNENKLKPLQGELKEKLAYALQLRITGLKALEEQFKLSNPMVKQKEGWAEVVLAGKRVDLAFIKKDDKFVITDTKTRLEVLCTKKEIL
ncbi:MAG: Exodeoxyribonuclease VII large subunit (EC [uncultured Sulfurovum sp.]|uniref:Exodeoxyribonuclease 7 large subunit n=1 Tax=uncultured Sulfurovum sp. TaxID=269237 RepID=A0A6S6SJU7_9BACT|nr:MAG: Exodeoxyribonuclease VII large subunit (EC [uncultured Sulfurovum sp.]